MKYKWVVNGFDFDNESDYKLAKKDEEVYMYIMEQIGQNRNNHKVIVEVYNKLIYADKFKTVVGIAHMKELHNYIISKGIANTDELEPIKGFAIKKTYATAGYSNSQMERLKNQMNESFKQKVLKYKNTVNTMKITIFVLSILVATLFYLGINKNNASNYASAREAVLDEYTKWEQELTEREQAIKEKEEELKHLELK